MHNTNRSARAAFKRARRIAGFTQTTLAKRMKVTPAAVSAWEQGTRTPADTLVPTLAKALKMTPAELLAVLDLPITN